MPPLNFGIPVIRRGSDSTVDKGKAPVRSCPRPRTYNDEPLPVKPSDQTPRNAQIAGRELKDDLSVGYQLKIGEVEVEDVGLEEILDYVSPRDLEEFEHRQFLEEREVLKAVEAATEERRRAKLERQKERAKRKGTVVFEEVESTEGLTDGENVEVGKHGRARPTYKHLFKKVKERQRRKRDPATGELMALSEDEAGMVLSADDSNDLAPATRPSVPVGEVQKRRRRKRDKVTGELLSLSPVSQHSIILEPKKRGRPKKDAQATVLAFRSGLENDNAIYEDRRTGSTSQSFRKLSIAEEPQAKRQRLDTESSSSRSLSPIPTKADITAQLGMSSPVKTSRLTAPPRKDVVIELVISEDVFESEPTPKIQSVRQPLSKPTTSKQTVHPTVGVIETSSAYDSTPEAEARTSILRPSATKPMKHTSLTEKASSVSRQLAQTPSMAKAKGQTTRTLSSDTLARVSDEVDDESKDDLEEDEYVIESILNHAYSDPTTHPREFGGLPVMLYEVKWEGSDELTWEPLISFGDESLVREYRRQAGLDSEPNDDEMDDGEDGTMVASKSKRPLPLPSQVAALQSPDAANEQYEDEESEEDEFELEDILAHHHSDPRTHPPEFGKTPIILYQVKWQGWDKLTWEPASSFPDKSILQNYHIREAKKGR